MKIILTAIVVAMLGVACGSAVDPEPSQEPAAEKTEQTGEALVCGQYGAACGTGKPACCFHLYCGYSGSVIGRYMCM